ncbi:MAG TPA: acyl-CoA synthetase [Acidimicrobiia bacterium]|nr:acyl-CoA synthetase [Acidimicrobiia bacterium]
MEFNIADLFECVADAVPAREAVVCGFERRTYADLDERATRLAHSLRAAGVGIGDHVGLYLRNSVAHVEAMLACYKARAVPINVNYRYVAEELRYLCDDADLVALFHDEDTAAHVDAVRPSPLKLIVVAGTAEYEELVRAGSAARDLGPRSPDDRYVLYTGGTTGRPKGVVWRQEDMFFGGLGSGNPGGPPITAPEQIAASVLDNPAQRLRPFLPPGDTSVSQFVSLALGPLMHASGQWSALGTLLGGGKVVLYGEQHVDMERVLDLLERERVNACNLVGDASARPMLDALVAQPDRWDLSSLRLLGSGGSIMSGAVKDGLMAALPSVLAIVEGIGSSESPAQAVALTTRSGAPSASLTFAAKAETIVVDDDLRPVAPGSGVVGRLATRGRVPLEYYKDPERSARTFVELDGARWSLPGDMATIDADGTVHLLGRGSLCINTGGEKVYPEEVEAVLKVHPAVADAVVLGAPDERFGQRVVAIIAVVPGNAPPDLEALQAHCRAQLAGYKVPRALQVVDEIERTPAGKPDYEWARREIGA